MRLMRLINQEGKFSGEIGARPGTRFDLLAAGTIRNMITAYGIPNCDTVKKARAWLSERQLEHEFHDFKKRGVPAQRLAAWEQALGWQKLLNRQGTTWRKLDAATQLAANDAAGAQALMLGQPSTIRRPVVEWGSRITVGFDAASWAAGLAAAQGNPDGPPRHTGA